MFHDLRYGLRMLVKSPGFSRRGPVAGARHRREHRDLQPGQRGPAPADAGGGAARARVRLHDRSAQPRQPSAVAPQLQGPARAERGVHRDGVVAFAQVNWSHGQESEQIPPGRARRTTSRCSAPSRRWAAAFRAEEEAKATPVTVVSHGFWERSLGRDPAAVGRTLTLNRTPFTIVGIAPKGFTGTLLGGGPVGWVPMAMHDRRAAELRLVRAAPRPVPVQRSRGSSRASPSSRRAPTSRPSSRSSSRRSPSTTRDAAPARCRCSKRA